MGRVHAVARPLGRGPCRTPSRDPPPARAARHGGAARFRSRRPEGMATENSGHPEAKPRTGKTTYEGGKAR